MKKKVLRKVSRTSGAFDKAKLPNRCVIRVSEGGVRQERMRRHNGDGFLKSKKPYLHFQRAGHGIWSCDSGLGRVPYCMSHR